MMKSNTWQIVGAATGAAVVAAFILYGPTTRRKKRKKGTCVGLMNLGNTCFMNAVLQALAPCQSIHEWLHNVLLNSGHSVPWLVYALHNVWKVLNNLGSELSGVEGYSPVEILEALRLHNWRISPDEQDAHELFHVITETLDEETARYPALLSLFDVNTLQDPYTDYQSDKKARNRIGTRLPVLPKRNEHPFRGLLASKLQCTVCGHKNPVRYDTFDSMSLTIPNVIPNMMTLELLMKQYISPERVNDVSCEGCQKLRGSKAVPKTTFMKTLTIGKLPPCLCVHIQRTQWLPNGMPMKSPVPIQYPQCLSMDPFVCVTGENKYQEKQTLKSLAGLVGGNTRHTPSHKCIGQQFKVRQPYPRLVSELKALHYTDKYYCPGIGMGGDTCEHTSEVGHLHHKGRVYRATSSSTQILQNKDGGDTQKVVPSIKPGTLNLAQLFRLQRQSTSAANMYNLMSVVEHYGDVFSGHFVTYRRVPGATGSIAEKWLFTSDMTVRKVAKEEALRAEAYMLFYERQGTQV